MTGPAWCSRLVGAANQINRQSLIAKQRDNDAARHPYRRSGRRVADSRRTVVSPPGRQQRIITPARQYKASFCRASAG